MAHKMLKLVLLSNSYTFLPRKTGATRNQTVELAKDWRSDCLEKQNLLVVEICGVLGRLHSIEGLAQTNNNAKLNKGAKHVTKVADYKCKSERTDARKVAKVERTQQIAVFFASLFFVRHQKLII